MELKTLAIILILLFFQIANSNSEGLGLNEQLSFSTPLHDKDFENWDTQESTVFLKNKVVLAPEGPDQIGYLASTHVSFLFGISAFTAFRFTGMGNRNFLRNSQQKISKTFPRLSASVLVISRKRF